jgi:hypothetical protein
MIKKIYTMSPTILDMAKGYEPKKTLNIADLDKVNVDFVPEERTGTDSDGKEFRYNVVVQENKEYRIPNVVFEELQKALKIRADIKSFKVIKKGSGLNTRYNIEVLE